MMRLSEALAVPKGVTAVVGGGGKTSLIDRLCLELADKGTVLRLTTVQCWPPPCPCLGSPCEDELAAALVRHRVVAVGELASNGKLNAPGCPLPPLAAVADYVLIEADGSRGLPLKAPADHEPVFTGLEGLVIAVAGMIGLEKPIRDGAHRPERYAALIHRRVENVPSPEDAARVLESPQGQKKNVSVSYAVVLNQCDTAQRLRLGRACAEALTSPCVLTALQTRPEWSALWRK